MANKLYDDAKKYNPTYTYSYEEIGNDTSIIYWDYFHWFDSYHNSEISKDLPKNYMEDLKRFNNNSSNYTRLIIQVSVNIDGSSYNEYLASIDPSKPYIGTIADGITICKYDNPNLKLEVKNTNKYSTMTVTVLNIESYKPINVYKTKKSKW